MREYGLTVLVAAAVTYLLTPLVRRFAIAVGAEHRGRARDVHTEPVPLLGGIAMYLGLAAGLLVASRLTHLGTVFMGSRVASGLLLAGGLVVVMGFVDDRWGLGAITKLAGQVAAGAIVWWSGAVVAWLPWPGGVTLSLTADQQTVLTILVVVVTINAVNFIDGLDGLAAGIVGIGAAAFFLYYYTLTKRLGLDEQTDPALASAILAGVCLGFLPHNFHPARIFMGDTGSMLLGLLLAYAPIASLASLDPNTLTNPSAYSGGTVNRFPEILPLLVPAIIMLIPYADLLLAVVRRTRAGRSPFSADKKHLQHRLLAIGHSHRGSVLLMYLWASLFAGTVVLLSIMRTKLLVLGIVTVAGVLVLLLASMPRLRWWNRRSQLRLATSVAGPGPGDGRGSGRPVPSPVPLAVPAAAAVRAPGISSPGASAPGAGSPVHPGISSPGISAPGRGRADRGPGLNREPDADRGASVDRGTGLDRGWDADRADRAPRRAGSRCGPRDRRRAGARAQTVAWMQAGGAAWSGGAFLIPAWPPARRGVATRAMGRPGPGTPGPGILARDQRARAGLRRLPRRHGTRGRPGPGGMPGRRGPGGTPGPRSRPGPRGLPGRRLPGRPGTRRPRTRRRPLERPGMRARLARPGTGRRERRGRRGRPRESVKPGGPPSLVLLAAGPVPPRAARPRTVLPLAVAPPPALRRGLRTGHSRTGYSRTGHPRTAAADGPRTRHPRMADGPRTPRLWTRPPRTATAGGLRTRHPRMADGPRTRPARRRRASGSRAARIPVILTLAVLTLAILIPVVLTLVVLTLVVLTLAVLIQGALD